MTTETTIKECNQCGQAADRSLDTHIGSNGLCNSCEKNTCMVRMMNSNRGSFWTLPVCGKSAKGWMVKGSSWHSAMLLRRDAKENDNNIELQLMCGLHMAAIRKEIEKEAAHKRLIKEREDRSNGESAARSRADKLIMLINKSHPNVAPSLMSKYNGFGTVEIKIDELVALVCEKETPHDG